MRSIGKRFVIAVAVLTVAFSALAVFGTWSAANAHVKESIRQEASLDLEFDLAIREHAGETVRPAAAERNGDALASKDLPTPFVPGGVLEAVRRRMPDYVIRFSSDHPRNPANRAGPEEVRILEHFRRNPRAKRWSGRVHMNGAEHYAHFRPRRMEASCLRCHGRPEEAPASLVGRCGEEAGFHRSVGEVVALDTVAIPMAKVNAAVVSEAGKRGAVLAAGLAALLGAVALVFHRLVGRRLAAVADHSQRAAAQADSAPIAPIEVRGRDEIGVLAESCNVLAAKLRALRASLEQRAAQRNAEVEAVVAERKRAEAELRRSADRYRSLIENLPIGLYRNTPGPAGQFIMANPAIARMFGCASVAEFLRVPTCDLYADPAERKAFSDKLLAEGKVVAEELRLKRIDGTDLWAAVTANTVRNDSGEIVHFDGLVEDITARKRTEQALQEAKVGAEAASRAKSEFLANISHEIRTPMNAILGMTRLALDTELSAEQRESLEAVQDSAGALLRLINDILDFSRTESARLTLERVAFSLRDHLQQVLRPLRVEADAKDVVLSCRVLPDVPDRLVGDPGRLRQVLVNLVGNAVKFTERGSVQVRVQREAADGDGVRLRFSVRDTGIGIPAEKQQAVFRAFEQADGSMTRRYGGTGLGLAISAQLVELMEGQIDVDSCVGEGSTFTFTARFGAADPDRSEAPTDEAPDRLARPALSDRPLRILLAEDNATNQKLLLCLLAKWGHEVTVAGDGNEALLAWQRKPFDLILMDVQMPGRDGLAAAKEIRRREAGTGARLPIIAVTAHAMQGDRARCLQAGMDDYLCKPIDTAALQGVLLRVSQRRGDRPEAPSRPVPGAAPAAPGGQSLDIAAALARMDGDLELLREIAGLFRASAPEALADLERALADGDAERLARVAHKFKGSVGNFAAKPAFEAALNVETAAKGGDLDAARRHLDWLREEVSRLTEALTALAQASAQPAP